MLLVSGVLVIAIVGIAASFGSGPSTTQPKTTINLTGEDFGVGGILGVVPINSPSAILPNGTTQFRFLVTSSVVGDYAFAIASKGTMIVPPQNVSAGQPTNYPLPSYVRATFPGGTVLDNAANATVTVNITALGAPLGTVPLEFVVFQQQTPHVVAETAFPFGVVVG